MKVSHYPALLIIDSAKAARFFAISGAVHTLIALPAI
jgi:hypothetical protein